jgi:hypothetical protein
MTKCNSAVIAAAGGLFLLCTDAARAQSIDDCAAGASTTCTIASGTTRDGNLEAIGDIDAFRVDVIAGRSTYWEFLRQQDIPSLTLTGAAGVALRRADGTLVARDENSGRPDLGWVSSQNETLYISIDSRLAQGSPGVTGTYRLRQSRADDFGAGVPFASPLQFGQSISGDIEIAGDFDWFAVPVVAGHRYSARILGRGNDSLTNGRVCIQLYDFNGSSVTFQCSNGSASASFEFDSSASGTAYVAAWADFFGEGTYRFELGPPDDQREDVQTAGRVVPGAFVNGAITTEADKDWYGVPLQAGTPYAFLLQGSNSGIGTNQRMILRLRSPTGSIVASDTDGAGEAQFNFTPTETGQYFLEVESWKNLLFTTTLGTYRLNVNLATPPANTANIVASTLPTARSVQIGQPATLFATILNTGPQTATNCGVAPTIPLLTPFQFRRTNAQNQVIGVLNERFDIPPGGAGTFVLGFTAAEPFDSRAIQLTFDCANSAPAVVIPGVNDFLLTSTNAAPPDIVMSASTVSNDGIANIPGPNGTGFFAASALNIGEPASIAFAGEPTATAGVAPLICETVASTGACLAPPAASVTRVMGRNQSATFSIFLAGAGQTIPFDPANRRVNLIARDGPGATIRGAVGVAVRTQ